MNGERWSPDVVAAEYGGLLYRILRLSILSQHDLNTLPSHYFPSGLSDPQQSWIDQCWTACAVLCNLPPRATHAFWRDGPWNDERFDEEEVRARIWLAVGTLSEREVRDADQSTLRLWCDQAIDRFTIALLETLVVASIRKPVPPTTSDISASMSQAAEGLEHLVPCSAPGFLGQFWG